jgi:hypothetical protein
MSAVGPRTERPVADTRRPCPSDVRLLLTSHRRPSRLWLCRLPSRRMPTLKRSVPQRNSFGSSHRCDPALRQQRVGRRDARSDESDCPGPLARAADEGVDVLVGQAALAARREGRDPFAFRLPMRWLSGRFISGANLRREGVMCSRNRIACARPFYRIEKSIDGL